MIPIDYGDTNVSIDVQVVDDAGLPVLNLVANTFPTLSYNLAGAVDTAFPTLSNLAGLGSTWAAGGIKERGGGYYRLDLPDDFGSSSGVRTIRGEQTDKHLLCDKLVTSINLAAADQYIDKLSTPWALVYMKEGSGPPGTGIELLRKNLKDVDGGDLISTNTVVGQVSQ